MRLIDLIRQRQKAIRGSVVFSIAAYAFYLRLNKLAHHTLWADEMDQLTKLDRPFSEFLRLLPGWEFCSYLSGDFYLTYPFLKAFSYNKWGLAIPHIIITAIGLYLLYLVCKTYCKTLVGYVITFLLVCFNATMIWHATEIRYYAVLPTLALGAFHAWHLLTNDVNLTKGKRRLIAAFFIVVILFHAYGSIILLTTFFYNFLLRAANRKGTADFFRKNMGIFLPVFLITAPLWLFRVLGEHLAYRNDCTVFQYIPNPLLDFIGFLKGIFGNLIGDRRLYFLLAGVFFPFILPSRDKFRHIMLLFAMVILPISLILLSD
ncbi:MAG: hypothetical protein PHF11_04210, partial [Candidatus Omnitrophica bacterium]|nr:hypothetical protein [Candidatus Omnitrophota bacterium]